MARVRWGVLSTASIGRLVIEATRAADHAEFVAVASRDADRARAFADELGLEANYGSFEELLASRAVDAVYVPLPVALHTEWTIKALAAGKDVLCEKPLATSAADAARCFDAAEAAGRPRPRRLPGRARHCLRGHRRGRRAVVRPFRRDRPGDRDRSPPPLGRARHTGRGGLGWLLLRRRPGAEDCREPLKSDVVVAGGVCLQSDRAAVAHVLERRGDRGEVDLTCAWLAPAGHVGDLDLTDERVCALEQLDQVPFTDLCVVEVEHHPQPWSGHRL